MGVHLQAFSLLALSLAPQGWALGVFALLDTGASWALPWRHWGDS